MTRIFHLVALAACLACALPAVAQWQKPEDAIKYRQSAMALQNNHLGRVFATTSGRVPFDAKVAAEQIEIVAMINKLQFAAFIDGSDKGNTKATMAACRAQGQAWVFRAPSPRSDRPLPRQPPARCGARYRPPPARRPHTAESRNTTG